MAGQPTEKVQMCGEQKTDKGIQMPIVHRCVKRLEHGTTEHEDGTKVHRCYCSHLYLTPSEG